MNRFSMRLVVAALSLAAINCGTTAAKLYLRPDVDTSKSKIVVFPLMLNRGGDLKGANASFNNPLLDAALAKDWSSGIGETAVVVPKVALDKVPGAWEAMTTLVKVCDDASRIEQALSGADVTQFVQAVTEQFGDGAFAFALVFEDENTFKSTKKLHGNMGLFDSKKLTWKWITKYEDSYTVPVPYAVAVQKLFDASWQALKVQNNGAVR